MSRFSPIVSSYRWLWKWRLQTRPVHLWETSLLLHTLPVQYCTMKPHFKTFISCRGVQWDCICCFGLHCWHSCIQQHQTHLHIWRQLAIQRLQEKRTTLSFCFWVSFASWVWIFRHLAYKSVIPLTFDSLMSWDSNFLIAVQWVGWLWRGLWWILDQRCDKADV